MIFFLSFCFARNILGGSQHIRKTQQQRVQTSAWTYKTLYFGNGFGIIFPKQSEIVITHGRGEILMEHFRASNANASNINDG